jgi:hypothetical protein
MKREVRCLYRLLLKPGGKVLDVRNVLEIYEEYNMFRDKVLNADEAPAIMKGYFPKMDMPKYLEWVKQYLIKGEDE